MQGILQRKPVGVDGDPVPAGGDAGHGEGDAKGFLHFTGFAGQQSGKGAAHVAKTEQGKTMMGHGDLL